MIPKYLKKKFNQFKLFVKSPTPDKKTLALFHILNKSPDIKKLTYVKRIDKHGQLVCDSLRVNIVKGINLEISWSEKIGLDIKNVKPIEDLQNGGWNILANVICNEIKQQILWFCINDFDGKTKVVGLVPGTSYYFLITYI